MGKHGRGGTIPDQLPKATDIVWVANAPDQAGDPLHIHRPDHRRNRPVSTRGCQPRLTADGGILRIGSAGGAYDSVIHDLQLLSRSVLTGSADYVLTGQPSCRTTPYSTAPVRRHSRPAVTPSQTASSWTTADGFWCRSLTHNGCYDYLYSATAR